MDRRDSSRGMGSDRDGQVSHNDHAKFESDSARLMSDCLSCIVALLRQRQTQQRQLERRLRQTHEPQVSTTLSPRAFSGRYRRLLLKEGDCVPCREGGRDWDSGRKMDGDRPWQSNDPSASLSTCITCSTLTPACCVAVLETGTCDAGAALNCLVGSWFCAWCPRQRRCYPRTEPHGTRRNGRVGIGANMFYYIPEQMVMWVFLFISRGGYMNSGSSQSLSGALNRQNQLMQGGGMQGGAFGRRYWAPPHHLGLCTFFF